MLVRLNPLNSNVCVLMVPDDPVLAENKIGLVYGEVHQVFHHHRELANGIYVLNQTPSFSLEVLASTVSEHVVICPKVSVIQM